MRYCFVCIAIALVACSFANGLQAADAPEKARQKFVRTQKQAARALRAVRIQKTRMILYSLHPYLSKKGEVPANKLFHGNRILGHAEITSLADKSALIKSLAKSVEASDGNQSYCYKPRHGLRIITQTTEFDLSICFECSWMSTYNFNSFNVILTTAAPAALYNSMLDKYGVPKSKD